MEAHQKCFDGLLVELSKQNNILTDIKDKVLTITLNRHKKLNSISIDMYRKIQNIINDAQTNE